VRVAEAGDRGEVQLVATSNESAVDYLNTSVRATPSTPIGAFVGCRHPSEGADMNPRHRREDDGGGGSAAHDGVTEEAPGAQPGATGVATQAAFGDGIVGGTDGQESFGSPRQDEASESEAEVVSSDEEIGLAPGESD
jgi:hypothetical protein